MKRYQRPPQEAQTATPGIMPWRIRRVTGADQVAVEAGVVVEEPLEIRLDGRSVAVLMRTPGLEKELAAGFCLGEGLVSDVMDIALVQHCGRLAPADQMDDDALDGARNRVDVTLLPTAVPSTFPREAVSMIRSGCGRTDAIDLVQGLEPIDAQTTVGLAVLTRILGQITRRQISYRAAGGIHAAALFDSNGRAVVVCEDIGRHNAVDKALGYCLLRGIGVQDKMLVSTGRASYDMVVKGVRLGVPIIASISSPTSLAVELADGLGCTLLGYLRGKSLNIYTHEWRIVGES
ncbi:formate dehydrogenase accessory sulfurtransferase FdhD [Chloroflexota bacterium]